MQKVIVTIDVEGHVGSDPVNKLIYGITANGQRAGIDKIMDLLDEYQIKGLFFVDIAEAWHFGEDKIAGVLLHIKERGHDVGVHIHPDHMMDKDKLFLSEYTYAEQYEIIKRCTDFYEIVLHEKPIAFRAGKYGANRDTLAIISELGYKLDFSQFYGQKWCHIEPPITKISVEKVTNNLYEIPVSSYVSFNKKFYSRYDKLDAFLPYNEFKYIFNRMMDNSSYEVIVLFAHSFSFLNWRKNPNKVKFSKKLYQRFRRQIEYTTSREKVEFITLKDLLVTLEKENKFISKNQIEKNNTINSWFFLIKRAFGVFQARIDIKISESIEKD